jgi:hypothetical protein
MKTKTNILLAFASLFIIAVPLHADISNTNGYSFNGSTYMLNTGYGSSPYDVLNLQVTVNAGYDFNFSILDIFLSSSGGTPSPWLEILDSQNNILATSQPVTMNTATVQGLYYVNDYSTALAYDTTFNAPVNLGPGTYTFEIWDGGNQLNFLWDGAVNTSGVNVAMVYPYGSSTTPALSMSGNIAPVPEPSVLALAGLGGLLLFRRRK